MKIISYENEKNKKKVNKLVDCIISKLKRIKILEFIMKQSC